MSQGSFYLFFSLTYSVSRASPLLHGCLWTSTMSGCSCIISSSSSLTLAWTQRTHTHKHTHVVFCLSLHKIFSYIIHKQRSIYQCISWKLKTSALTTSFHKLKPGLLQALATDFRLSHDTHVTKMWQIKCDKISWSSSLNSLTTYSCLVEHNVDILTEIEEKHIGFFFIRMYVSANDCLIL